MSVSSICYGYSAKKFGGVIYKCLEARTVKPEVAEDLCTWQMEMQVFSKLL